MNLSPTGAFFSSSQAEQSVYLSSGTQQVPVGLGPIDPVSLLALPGNQSLRPGANLSVTVSSSDPKVVTITTPTIQFAAQQPIGNSNPTAGIQPVGTGTAIVTLGPIAGNPAPASGSELVYDVTEAELSIPPLILGRDLETPVQIKLGSSVPTPSADIPIMVNTSNPLGLAANPGDLGQFSIAVKIPAGQRLSQPFYVQSFGGVGPATLNYGGGSFPNFSTPVTLTQTAFVIQEANSGQPLDLKAGGTASLTIVPALSPPSNAAPQPLSIRGGASPIMVSIASTNPSVVSASQAQVTLNPGDQKATVSVQGLTPGTATVKLLGTGYDFGQPQSSIQVVVK